MTRYLPDSSVLILYARGSTVETDWLRAVLNTGEEVGACSITISECLAGAHPLERPGWLEVFARLRHWPTEPADAVLAGIWRYDFARRGLQLSITDLLIAAVAHRVDATIVTNNVKDFPMDDVRVQALS